MSRRTNTDTASARNTPIRLWIASVAAGSLAIVAIVALASLASPRLTPAQAAMLEKDARVKTPLSDTESTNNGPLHLGEGTLIAPERECLPWIAPEGDRYLCYARVDGEPQLWLATFAGGMERLLVRGAVHCDRAQDGRHIPYSPWASPPTAPDPQPVYRLDLMARGYDNAAIAAELCLARQTVRNYTSRVYAKLGVDNRYQAIIWAREHGYGN